MGGARSSTLASAQKLEAKERASAEQLLARALARASRAGERVQRARQALNDARGRGGEPLTSRVSSGLALRRHAAHTRAQQARLRALETELRARQAEHASLLEDVQRARAGLSERLGKEQALEVAVRAEQARQRRTRARREQDEQDERHAHRRAHPRGRATNRP